MNKQLLLALYDRSGLGAYMPVDYKGHDLAVEEHWEKFAELIVKECLDIASEVRGEPATDTHYVIGYDRACEKMISGIKEHFGVEE
jgi:hypothetical protein